MANTAVAPGKTERERVEDWRIGALVAAGWLPEHAAEAAARHDIDLHAACALVRDRGCPPALAWEILR